MAAKDWDWRIWDWDWRIWDWDWSIGRAKQKGESSQPKGESSQEPARTSPGEEKNKVKKPEEAGKTEEDQLQGQSSSQPGEGLKDYKVADDKNKGKKPEDDKDNKIYPGKFEITWGDDKNYWIKPTDENSKDPADLKKVCWLQVTGSKKDVKPGKSYEIKFNITLKAGAFGWNGLPLFLMAKIGAKGESKWQKIKPLEQTTPETPFDIPKPDEKFIVPIPADKGNEEQELFFGLYEIWSNKWKGGLRIHHATVKEARPDDVAK